ncbi:MAG: M14 family zinc carboxypeptidase, partial [Thermoplasmata archaeon]
MFFTKTSGPDGTLEIAGSKGEISQAVKENSDEVSSESGTSRGHITTPITQFHNYTTMESELFALQAAYPNIVKVYDIGNSVMGKNIYAVKVSDNVSVNETGEMDILYTGGIHGNEKHGVEMCMYLLNYFAKNYGTNSTITKYVNDFEIWIIPMLNPDGNELNTRGNYNGVDLNRNFPGSMNGDSAGAWPDPYASNPGSAPFSEPETQAFRDLNYAQHIEFSITFHTSGEEIYWPWGYDPNKHTPDNAGQQAAARDMAEKCGYNARQSAEVYTTRGDTDDWLYGYSYYTLGYRTNNTWPFTWELHNTQSTSNPADIDPLCRKNLEAALTLCEIAYNRSRPQLPEWTVLCYIDGDNNLETSAKDDINEMEVANDTTDVNIIAFVDYYSTVNSGKAKMYKIKRDSYGYDSTIRSTDITTSAVTAGVIPANLEPNMGDPQTLQKFLLWGMAQYPAQKYMVVLWDHGGGIMYRGDTSYTTKAVCFDDTSGEEYIDLAELRNVLSAVKNAGYNISILAFDACIMGWIETAYQVAPFADYTVMSQDSEPGDGYDYEATFRRLCETPYMSPADLAWHVVNDYANFYTIQSPDTTTNAAWDNYALKNFLVPLVNNLAQYLTIYMYDYQTPIKNARSSSTYIDSQEERDLFSFCRYIANITSLPQAIRDSAVHIMQNWSNSCIHERHTGSESDCWGASIYFPSTSYDSRYDTMIDFHNEKWDEFLKMFLNPSNVYPKVTHTPLPDTTNTASPYIVNATVISPTSVTVARLYYRTSPTQSFTQATMNLVSGSNTNGVWQ